jgi:hypothetical protein
VKFAAAYHYGISAGTCTAAKVAAASAPCTAQRCCPLKAGSGKLCFPVCAYYSIFFLKFTPSYDNMPPEDTGEISVNSTLL